MRYEKFILQGDRVACISMVLDLLSSTMPRNTITWGLKSKVHRQTSLEILMEGSTRLIGEKRLQYILDYDSVHMLEPGMSSEMHVREFGVTTHQPSGHLQG
jgi:hypothetical protein